MRRSVHHRAVFRGKRTRSPKGVALCVFWVAAGVSAGGCMAIGEPATSTEAPGPDGPSGAPPKGDACASAAFAGVTEAGLLSRFELDLHPKLIDPMIGCLDCHQPERGRRFVVELDSAASFYQMRADGFFAEGAGSLLARLTHEDTAARMPQGRAPWSPADVQTASDMACAVQAFDSQGEGRPADEVFPPELRAPYAGPAYEGYDNVFVDYDLLRNKIRVLFDDRWIREGVDRFNEHIGLLGGVDFVDHFVAARGPTADFLVALDALAADVCSAAVTGGSGPFAGLDSSTAPEPGFESAETLVDALFRRLLFRLPVETERAATLSFAIDLVELGDEPPEAWAGVCEALVRHPDFIFVRPPTLDEAIRPPVPSEVVRIEAETLQGTVGEAEGEVYSLWSAGFLTAPFTVNTPGRYQLRVRAFATRGGPDLARMELRVDGVVVRLLDVAAQRASPEVFVVEQDLSRGAHTFAVAFTNDFFDPDAGLDRNLYVDWVEVDGPQVESPVPAETLETLRLVRLAQAFAGRPPLLHEVAMLSEVGWPAMVDHYLATDAFRERYYQFVRLRLESTGTAASDEPARLWTWVMLNARPFSEVLTADHTVDENFERAERPGYHGRTGVLTMKGFIETKPGLPHYNYAARVMTDFMDFVFEVPAEVFEQRATSTPSSTVDPTGICFSCHQVLTPLAYQRLRWTDAGEYVETDADGEPIDDSDRGVVSGYRYKGRGMEAFSLQAVNKESFVRRMLNAQYEFAVGRPMRWRQDERDVYRQLWDVSERTGGELKAILRTIALSAVFRGEAQP